MKTTMNKPFSLKRKSYTMNVDIQEKAEITMYGEIVETQPRDWWTGDLVDGEFIIQSEFLNDLETVMNMGVKSLRIRMNSAGGDADVSVLIHNRIREIAKSGVETECIIDGIAESGGSLIACACDKVTVNSSSLFMLHKCWSFIFGGYNADELRSKATSLDATDKQQIAIYRRKSGKTDTIISHMMSNTTFLVGQEIIDEGFADELTESAESLKISASADKRFIFANGHRLHVHHGMALPDSIPITTPNDEGVIHQTSADTDNKEGGSKLMAKNLSELRTEDPELAAAVEQEVRAAASADNAEAEKAACSAAVAEERKRLAEISEVAHLFDDDIVKDAMYGNPCTRAEMTERAALKAAKSGESFMKDVLEDNKASGANDVRGALPTDGESTDDVKAAAKKAVADFKKMKEEAH